MTTLEDVVLGLIQHARDRCGSGFGKYPSGVRHAIGELLPLVNQQTANHLGQTIAERLAELDNRLQS